jgi:hypothetical protein
MTDKSNEVKAVHALIAKASESHSASEALHFSQAACNVANAICSTVAAQQGGG